VNVASFYFLYANRARMRKKKRRKNKMAADFLFLCVLKSAPEAPPTDATARRRKMRKKQNAAKNVGKQKRAKMYKKERDAKIAN